MKKLLFLLLFATSALAQVENWQGKTAVQLSGITSGTTNIASKTYWTTYAYAQIRDLYDMLTASAVTANDTTPDIGDATIYYTANTSTTAIDSLPFVGDYRKVIRLHVMDDYTTITHSVGHLDCGGVSLDPDSNDVIIGFWTGSKWHVNFEFIE